MALSGLGRTGEVLDLLGGERENVEHLHGPRLTGPYYCRLALAHAYLGEHEGAHAAARRAVGEAARCGDEPIIGRAQFASAVADWGLWQFGAVMEQARHAVRCLTRVGDSHWLARSRRVLGLVCFGVAPVILEKRSGRGQAPGEEEPMERIIVVRGTLLDPRRIEPGDR